MDYISEAEALSDIYDDCEIYYEPYSKEAKMLKESYYAALDKLLEQKGE